MRANSFGLVAIVIIGALVSDADSLVGHTVTSQHADTVAAVRTTADLLAQQLAREQAHNRDLLSSVHWAVGGVITMVAGALVLVAVVSSVNYLGVTRRLREDKESLRSELHDIVEGELQSAIDRVTASSAEVTAKLEMQLAETAERLDARIATIAKDLDNSIQGVNRRIVAHVAQLKLEREMDTLKEALTTESSDYALWRAAEALELSHEADMGWLMHEDLLELVRRALAKKPKIEIDTSTKLTQHLEPLREKYPDEVDGIRQLLRVARAGDLD